MPRKKFGVGIIPDDGLPGVQVIEAASDTTAKEVKIPLARKVGEIAGAAAELIMNTSGRQVTEGISISPATSQVESLLRKHTPKDKATCIRLAQEWRETDDFLCKLVEIISNFTVTGMGFHVQAGSYVGKPVNAETKDSEIPPDPYAEATDFLRLFDRRYDMRKVVEDLLRDYRVTDSMILYWKMKSTTASDSDIILDSTSLPASPYEDLVPGLVDISALNPADVTWNNSLGMNILSVKIPTDLKDRIKLALAADNTNPRADKYKLPNGQEVKFGDHVKSMIQSGVHVRWIIAVALGFDFVELKNEDGDYWLIKTKERKHHGLAKPSMATIFIALVTRQLLSDGEFTAAFVTKHFIMLIQGGESIPTGPMAGARNNYLTPDECVALLAKFSDTSKAMKVCVDHTIKISFVFPPAEFFNSEKFVNCEGRILNWADVTYAVTQGEGGSYGSGFIGIKRLIAGIAKARSDGGDLITRFFDHPSIREHIDIDEGADVVVSFDEQILKEPQQLLREVEMLFKAAILDSRTAASELGRNPDRLRQSKLRTRAEDAADGSWSPINNGPASVDTPSVVDKGGRPNNPETVKNPDTRIQTGSPQT